MLIKKNLKDRNKSKYMCNRCGKTIIVYEKHRVKVTSEEYGDDIWDFCHDCYNEFFKEMWEE